MNMRCLFTITVMKWGGGWVAQDKSSFIKGNDVKKELQKPHIKQFDATRKVYVSLLSSILLTLSMIINEMNEINMSLFSLKSTNEAFTVTLIRKCLFTSAVV